MEEFIRNDQDMGDYLSDPEKRFNKIQRVQFSPLEDEMGLGKAQNIEKLAPLKLEITAELGRTTLTVGEFLALQEGDILELTKVAGDMVDIYINEQPFAQGEILLVHNLFSVRLSLSGSKHKFMPQEDA